MYVYKRWKLTVNSTAWLSSMIYLQAMVPESLVYINADHYHSDTILILLSHDRQGQLNRRREDICVYVSDVPIIRSVIGIAWSSFLVSVSVTCISKWCNQYWKTWTNNVISCDYSIINYLYIIRKYSFSQKAEGRLEYRIGIGYCYNYIY